MAYLGIVTVDTMEFDSVIIERSPVERQTTDEALADARLMLQCLSVDLPAGTLNDPKIGFLVVR